MIQSRNLAAIIFTDMVGYSSIAKRNEKLALELSDKHRQLVHPFFLRFNGREIELQVILFLLSLTAPRKPFIRC